MRRDNRAEGDNGEELAGINEGKACRYSSETRGFGSTNDAIEAINMH